jgi:uncharacterized protein Usg
MGRTHSSTIIPSLAAEANVLAPDRLLSPTRNHRHPEDVLNDVGEKRAIVSSWASDACAVEFMPALRQPPGAGGRCHSSRHGCAKPAQRHRFDSFLQRRGSIARNGDYWLEARRTGNGWVVSRELRMQTEGYGLTTVEFHYHVRPPWPAAAFLSGKNMIWRPTFPNCPASSPTGKKRYGVLHSVRVSHHFLIRPSECRAVDGIIGKHRIR